MKTLDLDFIREYFEEEIHRLEKVATRERAAQEKNLALLAVYKEYGAPKGMMPELESKLSHSAVALGSVTPRLEKLREQLEILSQ